MTKKFFKFLIISKLDTERGARTKWKKAYF